MSAYRLIDTDTREIVATGDSPAEVLAATPYLPSDCLDGATSWAEVWESSRSHADGIMGLVEGYTVERCPRVYGVAEVAEACGVSPKRVAVWLARGNWSIPEPDDRLACGPIWYGSTIEPWIRARLASSEANTAG